MKVKVISLPYIFPGFVCFVLYLAKISGERLQDHWSSGLIFALKHRLWVLKFQLKIVIFTAVKNRCLLHGPVFVMKNISTETKQDFF